ncbi:S49 family peptidase [Tistrella sp. BH-R2-4]|uniref:S49 family peptidase n=1 Tax=Tistrella arctica TaxID=3133430 RepID=A0ABU9YPH0_9PROT
MSTNRRGLRRLLRFLPVKRFRNPPPVVSVLRLDGTIMAGRGFRSNLSYEGLQPLIDRAFKVPEAKAVALVINSPGGSPAQSSLIYKHIRAMAAEKKLPVLAFVEDVAASGGYWLAVAGDEIYVDETTMVGSIGVVSAGFGFDRAIARLAVDRRVHTIGENKMRLDPFQPENPDDVSWLGAIQKQIHDRFIEIVRTGRGERLNKAGDTPLFNGDVWVGQAAVDMGLADGVGDLRGVLRNRFGDDVKLVAIREKQGLLGRVGIGVTARAGARADGVAAMVSGVADAIDSRALWQRYGL